MLRGRDTSITKKLTRMNALVSGTALLMACAAFVAYDLITFRETIVHNLSIQAQIAGSNSVSALLFNDPQEVEKTLSALRAAPNIVSAHIYKPDGLPFATYWRDRGGQAPTLLSIPAGQTEAHWFKDGQIVLVRSILFQGKPTGTVYIRSDLHEMTNRLKRYAGIAAIVLLTSLLVALPVSSIFQRALAEPIVHLAEIARIVSRDRDYSVRAIPAGNRDELATLIETFNEMLAQIQERDRALQKAHDDLEQRVQERTAELTEANERLQQEITERRRIQDALRASEERFRSLAETANEAILSADSQGNIVYFNPAAERIFCYSSKETIGLPLTVLMPERFRDPHRQGLDRYLRTGEARVVGKTVELVGRRKDGTEFPIELSLSSWKTQEGIFFTGILSDITERKQAGEALERQRSELVQSNADLAAANKELEAFSYSVSHDLRAPLRRIDGFSKVLMDEYVSQLDPTAQRYLKLVRDGARNMGQLVDDLLNLGRIGRQELVRKPTDLNLVLQNALRDLQPEWERRPIDWRIGNLPTLECDPGLMKVVFANLLSNAVKYTRRRECAVIEVDKVLLDHAPVIFVRDNGAGFEQQYAHKLFGVFQRLHRVEDFEGTGIGLATVQRIIQKHGGKIWAEGEVDKGATFFFTLAATSRSTSNTKDPVTVEVSYDPR